MVYNYLFVNNICISIFDKSDKLLAIISIKWQYHGLCKMLNENESVFCVKTIANVLNHFR